MMFHDLSNIIPSQGPCDESLLDRSCMTIAELCPKVVYADNLIHMDLR